MVCSVGGVGGGGGGCLLLHVVQRKMAALRQEKVRQRLVTLEKSREERKSIGGREKRMRESCKALRSWSGKSVKKVIKCS